jgi:osmoprotectant transport system substrate-binding protein
VRKEVLDQYPEIADILKPLTEKLTTAEVQQLNAEVSIEHKEAYQVAKEWLKREGLL